MSMLNAGQALRELPLVVVVDIGEIGDAGAFAGAPLAGTLKMGSQNVAHCFAAGRVAALRYQLIEGSCQRFI
ncbi:MAG: hypothetical protein PVS2B1_21830 [Candidatus Dormibacteraceae bacterium]